MIRAREKCKTWDDGFERRHPCVELLTSSPSPIVLLLLPRVPFYLPMAANLRTRISELSSAIKRQEEILKNLRKSRSDAQCELNALVDPMARLPLEISSDIFALCAPEFPHPCRDEAPVTLLRVSRAWRSVALSSAPLWTALLITSTRSDELRNGVHNWFARARDLPLSLSVQGPADKAIQLLVRKYASRLRNVQMPCPRGMQLEKTTTPWFPSMKILTIDHSRHHSISYDMDLRSPCFPLLHNTPNLVECTLDGDCDLEYTRPTQPLKLPGLRYLNLKHSSGHILEHLTLPALECILLASRGLHFDIFRAFTTRSSPPLLSLTIRWAGYTEMQDLFLPLTSLVHLSLQASGGLVGKWPSEIFKLLALFSPQELLPSLRRLTVHQVNKPVTADDYQMLLTALSARKSRLQSFRLSLGANDRGPSPETIVSLRELAAGGMNICIILAGREKNLI
ncbi:hypothetical protein DFH06DRAFT_49037 [Mycena polygramma]|nr:hypothetical protein DFH06DRAFT_49037 [Mycena polygramma]